MCMALGEEDQNQLNQEAKKRKKQASNIKDNNILLNTVRKGLGNKNNVAPAAKFYQRQMEKQKMLDILGDS